MTARNGPLIAAAKEIDASTAVKGVALQGLNGVNPARKQLVIGRKDSKTA
jgi:hypothetical protein